MAGVGGTQRLELDKGRSWGRDENGLSRGEERRYGEGCNIQEQCIGKDQVRAIKNSQL